MVTGGYLRVEMSVFHGDVLHLEELGDVEGEGEEEDGRQVAHQPPPVHTSVTRQAASRLD